MLAGHETTANTLTFGIMELCKHPDMQTRLRNEIHEMERQRGDSAFSAQDFDGPGMRYLTAVIKVSQITIVARSSLINDNRKYSGVYSAITSFESNFSVL